MEGNNKSVEYVAQQYSTISREFSSKEWTNWFRNHRLKIAFYFPLIVLALFSIFLVIFNRSDLIAKITWLENQAWWVGILISLVTAVIAIEIFYIQHVQTESNAELSRSIKQDIMGSLRNFDEVDSRMEAIISKANLEPSSELFFMGYWFWFGADKGYDSSKGESRYKEIGRNSSSVATLLLQRASDSNLKTTVVLSSEGTLSDRISNILKYRHRLVDSKPEESSEKEELEVQPSDLEDIKNRYLRDRNILKNHVKENNRLVVHERDNIPSIVLAVKGNNKNSVVYCVGETDILGSAKFPAAGGFLSSDKAIVDMLAHHVSHLAQNEFSPTEDQI